MKNNILVYGSLAFDVIFSIPEDFRKSIPLEDGKIRSFNATYVANEKNEYPGGCAGNVAFWLAQTGTGSTIYSAFGRDFTQKKYRQKLENLGVDIRGYEGEFTAHAYMISDPLHQQLIIWQPNSYAEKDKTHLSDYFSPEELKSFKYVIFSPGSPNSFKKHIAEFRKNNSEAIVIFDPGQVSPFFTAEDFQFCLKKSDILIGNDIEFQHFRRYVDGEFPSNMTLIETLGERGVKLIHKGKEKNFSAQKVEKVVETTGAGDAFRGGLLSVLAQDENMEAAIRKGIEFGAQSVGYRSGQF